MGASTVQESLKRLVEQCRAGNATILKSPEANQQELRLEMARTIEQLVALNILELSLSQRLLSSIPSSTSVESASHLIFCGIDLVNQIISNDDSADSHYTGLAAWCRCRFLMHRAMCESTLNQHREAMRDLIDAEATLSSSASSRRDVDSAIIELYRAEVCLRRASTVYIEYGPMGQTAVPFRDFHTLLKRKAGDNTWRPGIDPTLWRVESADLINELWPDPESEAARDRSLRTAYSYVQDAVSFLSRAESIFPDAPPQCLVDHMVLSAPPRKYRIFDLGNDF